MVAVIRRLRPYMVLYPWAHERHPDHEAAGALVGKAVFFAGVRKFPGGPAAPLPVHHVKEALQYPMRHEMTGSFIVDISAVADRKAAAIAAYTSQLRPPTPTLIGSALTVSAFEARDRYVGSMIGVDAGEAYLRRGPHRPCRPHPALPRPAVPRGAVLRAARRMTQRRYDSKTATPTVTSTGRALRVGIVCYPTFGGSGVVATEIGLALAARGCRVHVLSYEVPSRLDHFVENVLFHEVATPSYPLLEHSPYTLALASKIVEVTRYEGLDVLHVHYAVPHATSAYLARQILGPDAPRIVTTLHGTDITLVGSDPSFLPITRFSILASDGVTTPSAYLRQATHDLLDVPASTPIEVIPNFVDTARFTPTPRRTLAEVHPLPASQALGTVRRPRRC